MIYKFIMVLGIIFSFTGCFRVASGTKIELNNVTKAEYERIKVEINENITNLNPSFDCNYDQEYWRENRINGELVCMGDTIGEVYVKNHENSINIIYNGTYAFWIPTKELITEEHKKIQKIFLELASKYKKKYSDVKVIFYHQDLPKEGRRIF